MAPTTLASVVTTTPDFDEHLGARGHGGTPPGMMVPVEEGTVSADLLYALATNGTITLGSTALTFQVTQDATGSRVLSYGTAYDFGTAGAPTLTTAVGKTDLLRFVYNLAATKLFYEGSSLGL